MTDSTKDQIEKEILLRAPRARVWRAVSDSKEFGAWFQAEFEGPFRAGATIRGRITYPGHEGIEFEIRIEEMTPERRFSFRWHPGAVDPALDYSKEPTTLVAFALEDAVGGTLLRLTESGFDAIPIVRRANAYKSNDGGWTLQMAAIEKYVSGKA